MRSIVVLVFALLALAACEPDYVTTEEIAPLVNERVITDAYPELDALMLEHEALIVELLSRLSSSEEKTAFDVTRAKRQLIGSTHAQRRDVDTMIDIHASNAYSEIARTRSRVERFDGEARRSFIEHRTQLSTLDDTTIDQIDAILTRARETFANDQLEEWVTSAEQSSVSTAEKIQNEINKLK